MSGKDATQHVDVFGRDASDELKQCGLPPARVGGLGESVRLRSCNAARTSRANRCSLGYRSRRPARSCNAARTCTANRCSPGCRRCSSSQSWPAPFSAGVRRDSMIDSAMSTTIRLTPNDG